MRPRHLALLFILLAATALRLYHLDYRALWWDEGLSLFFARLDYVTNARMAVTLADTNPPIYRLLLGGWMTLLGSSAFSTRLFSVFPGIITVALAYRLTRQLHLSSITGLIASTLCAASPMLIYYAQEAKGYSLVAMAGVASVVLWLRLTPYSVQQVQTDKQRLGAWGLYALSILLIIGSHYISVFLIAVQNLWTLVLTVRHWHGNQKQWLTHWAWMLGAQAIAALVLLPFVILTFSGTSATMQGQTGEFNNLNPIEFIQAHFIELTSGPAPASPVIAAAGILIIYLIIIGIWRLNNTSRWLLGTWIFIPIAFGFALNSWHEFFFPRFVLYTVPPIMLLVANGIAQISQAAGIARRYVPVAITALSLALWSPTLLAQYNTPTAAGEDWRPIANTIRPLVRSTDTAIYTWGWIPGYLDAYLPPAPQPHYELGFFTLHTLDSQMQAITANRDRVWLFDYEIDQFDPRNLGGTWLQPRAALVYDSWPGEGKGHIALFTLQPSPSQSAATINHLFTNGLTLNTTRLVLTASPSDSITAQLNWTPTRSITDRYTVFLHLLAPDGSLIIGRDAEPYNGSTPTTDWQINTTYTELRGLLIPPDLPPDTYTLQVGMYNTLTGEVDAAGPVIVGEVTLQ